MDITRVIFVSLFFSLLLKEGVGIIGGNEVRPHSIPYQAYLSITGNDGRTWRCGGSLISTNYILTAARCCSGASSVEIILGAHDISSDETTQVRVSSQNFTVHPEFTTNVPNFVYLMDMALIALPQPVELTKNVQTVRLPSSSHLFQYTNRNGTISGWGLTDGFDDTSYQSVLRSQQHTIISNEECQKVYFDLKSYDICMATNEADSPCVGDYGSPLTVDDIQVGIASQHVTNCIPGYPFLYTRVSDFLSWIIEVTDYEDEGYDTTTSESSSGSSSITSVTMSTTEIYSTSEGTTESTSTTTGRAPDSPQFPSRFYYLIYVMLANILVHHFLIL